MTKIAMDNKKAEIMKNCPFIAFIKSYIFMKILISCKDIDEALLLSKYDVDIIDVKNPNEGSLGANFPWVIEEIRKKIVNREISATIGDVDFKPGTYSLAAYCLKILNVDYIKAGLLIDREKSEILTKSLRKATEGKKLILCSYADFKHIGSISPIDLIDIAYKYEADGVMIDTYDKSSNRNVFDYLSLDYLKEFVTKAREHDLIVAIAGKIGINDIDRLMDINPDVIGFRSAVCDKREGKINESKLLKLIEKFKSC